MNTAGNKQNAMRMFLEICVEFFDKELKPFVF